MAFLGPAAVPLAIAAAGISAGGALYQGIAAKQEADANADQAKSQARFDANQIRRRTTRLLSTQRAGFGKAGVTLEGTPGEVLEDQSAEGELDALAALYGGKSKAFAFKRQGKAALIGGIFNAASAAVGGSSSLLAPKAPSGFVTTSTAGQGFRRGPSGFAVGPV